MPQGDDSLLTRQLSDVALHDPHLVARMFSLLRSSAAIHFVGGRNALFDLVPQQSHELTAAQHAPGDFGRAEESASGDPRRATRRKAIACALKVGRDSLGVVYRCYQATKRLGLKNVSRLHRCTEIRAQARAKLLGHANRSLDF